MAYADMVSHIWTQPSPLLQQPEFHFTWSQEAAIHNWACLTKYNLDLNKALAHQRNTPLEFGSEFRSIELLQPLLEYHPLWHRVHTWLTQGVQYPLAPISESQRQVDLRLALLRGNHKSAKQEPHIVKTSS